MRIIGGALCLLVVLLVVDWQAKSQVGAVAEPVKRPMPDGSTWLGTPKHIEQQVQKALENAMNTACPRSVYA